MAMSIISLSLSLSLSLFRKGGKERRDARELQLKNFDRTRIKRLARTAWPVSRALSFLGGGIRKPDERSFCASCLVPHTWYFVSIVSNCIDSYRIVSNRASYLISRGLFAHMSYPIPSLSYIAPDRATSGRLMRSQE